MGKIGKEDPFKVKSTNLMLWCQFLPSPVTQLLQPTLNADLVDFIVRQIGSTRSSQGLLLGSLGHQGKYLMYFHALNVTLAELMLTSS